jgi:glycosyltransferase involved in cell wall biosynthesis
LKALRKIDADIYFESPAGVLTGLTAVHCRWNKRKFIFRVASDVDCIPGRQLITLWRDRKIFEYGLRRADVIAAQSNYQSVLLKKHYGLDSDIVNMALEAPTESLNEVRDIDVLWISNIKQVKRPDLLISLARSLPKVKFTMIGGIVRGEESLYSEIEKRSAQSPNVEFLGQVPYQHVNACLARAKVFVNTSDIEGFPNTFLQAWARKVPVVSYFDPDGLILSRDLGRRPVTEEEMRNALCDLLQNEKERERLGERAHRFALTEYSADVAAEKYLELCKL